jgi:hypothetical protein
MRAEGSAGGGTTETPVGVDADPRRRLRQVFAIVAAVLVLLAAAMPQNLVALLDKGRTDPVSRAALEAARGLEAAMSAIGTPQLYEGLRERFQRLRQ